MKDEPHTTNTSVVLPSRQTILNHTDVTRPSPLEEAKKAAHATSDIETVEKQQQLPLQGIHDYAYSNLEYNDMMLDGSKKLGGNQL
jgi:hypothetical protein